jgi:uncharacterized protein (DUF302 family)
MTSPPARTSRIGSLFLGIVVGILVTAVGVWVAMPRLMLTTHESRYDDVETTCQELKKAAEAAGWVVPAIRDMNASMAKQGVQHEGPVRIVELCKATYAHEVLSDNPEVSTLMPCALGVYAGGDGKVYVSGMNMGLMGRMFGGTVGEVMGGKVAGEEQKILAAVVRQ